MEDIVVYEKDEEQLYQDVRSILIDARDRAYNNANKIMAYAYWKIGQRIVEQEQDGKERANYGSYVIKRLSQHLGDEFGSGFSVHECSGRQLIRRGYGSLVRNDYNHGED